MNLTIHLIKFYVVHLLNYILVLLVYILIIMYNVEGSRIIAREMDSLLAASNFMFPVPPAADHFAKNKETAHSETYNYMNNQNSSQQSSGLTRYQSVPSSFLESFVNDSVADAYHSSNLETEMNFFDSGNFKYTKGVKTDSGKNSVSSGVEDLFRGFSSNAGVENLNQVKKETSNENRLSLVRQSSSPAGFVSSLANDDTGTGTLLPLVIYLLFQILYLMISFRFSRLKFWLVA